MCAPRENVADGRGLVMVLPLLELLPELQALFVALLADAATAGRLAQANKHCKELLEQRLAALQEERRLAKQAHEEARRQRKRAALLQFFEEVDGGAAYDCKAHIMAGGTPCGRRLRPARNGSLNVLMRHLECYHSHEYGVLMMVQHM